MTTKPSAVPNVSFLAEQFDVESIVSTGSSVNPGRPKLNRPGELSAEFPPAGEWLHPISMFENQRRKQC